MSDQRKDIEQHEALVQRVGKREFERREGESEMDFSARMSRLQAQMGEQRKNEGGDGDEPALTKAARVWGS